MKSGLRELAARYAIVAEYETPAGEKRRAPEATLRTLLRTLGVAAETPTEEAAGLAAAPASPAWKLRAPPGQRCYLPGWLENGRAWGIAIQLYALRSRRNWGIGDYADLAAIARIAAAAGADFVGVNPLHALFAANPLHCSPFSPSNRRFLNPLYIAVDAVPGFDALDAHERYSAGIAEARDDDLVDYAAVASAKLATLRALWNRGLHDRAALEEFASGGGEPLRRHALFEAISARMTAGGHGAGWHGWPEPWQDAESPTVTEFAASRDDEVSFHLWLQWLCEQQLEEARRAALDAGMRIGLYLDFAVGEAPDGSSTWSDPELTLRRVRTGAPPDYFNAAGQDWGLAPLSPVKMATTRAQPFGALIDAAAHRAGALRIDHAMALWQLFLIPDGSAPADGTYVRFPIADMIRRLAAVSNGNRTIVIGEDLGNVPAGFRDVMNAANILSCRLLFFERDAKGYIPPAEYPRNALVSLSTHDLPTFEGWWGGEDVDLRARFGLIGADAAEEQTAERRVEREQLLADLRAEGVLSDSETGNASWPALVVAVHRHLARSPSRLLAARIEDLVGQREPVNLPSTTDEYPNWRRKLAVPIESLDAHALFRAVTAALREERPRGGA